MSLLSKSKKLRGENMKANYLTINPEALAKALSVRNLNLAEVSVAMGYNRTYLVKCLNGTGKISNQAALLLERMYHILPDEYIAREEPAQELKSVEEVREIEITIDYDRLEKAIFSAVYKAIKAALNDGH